MRISDWIQTCALPIYAVSGIVDPYTALLLWWSHPAGGSVVMRRSTALSVGRFDDRYPCRAHSERDYWLRIAAIADIRELADGHLLQVGERVRDAHDAISVWQSRRILIDKTRPTDKGRTIPRPDQAATDTQ